MDNSFVVQSIDPNSTCSRRSPAETMQLSDALTQIDQIRGQVDRARVYRGYRSIPVGLSALFAVAAAGLQAWLLNDPLAQLEVYVAIWGGAALLSLIAAGSEIVVRYTRSASDGERARTRAAVGQFLPCLLCGGLLTLAMLLTGQEAAWLLPALWSILFSMGIFSSLRVLPPGFASVAMFYLLCGVANVLFAQGAAALAPWTMAIPFGAGQLWTAGLLYWHLERKTDRRHAP
ncbi:MAG: hypothetical protein DWQ34_20285 [Planctomycetota bacterium]|nr:MAG: hypothetical protein DWQ34_20285 [Planctomycetota bacterium]REJ94507.1 MAG: hypothetical protein DWQ29_02895 [Planctomycetota bacterium]REK21288.1 MAG: hypothetical protein DWQ41_22050 [Planctomycetota bacterium]REK32081.1 MAG: hypothetical protein DWQ45_18140 [Planctomycetota bacterium]